MLLIGGNHRRVASKALRFPRSAFVFALVAISITACGSETTENTTGSVGASSTTDPASTTLLPTTSLQSTTVPTTTPPEDAVPTELEGNWRGDHRSGEVINLNLRGTRWAVNMGGFGGVGGDLSVVGDTIVFVGVYECPGEFEYTWSIEGESLTLTPLGEDPCPRGDYLNGVVFTR